MLDALRRLFRGAAQEHRPLSGRCFVLDGSNIALLHGTAQPELGYVLAISHFLTTNGATFCCFFDANIRYIFRGYRPEQEALFDRLLSAPGRDSAGRERFQLVPGGTQADEWILQQAKSDGADVISNDRFRDRARQHRWIWKRRHGLTTAGGHVLIPSLDCDLSLPDRIEEYLPKTIRGS